MRRACAKPIASPSSKAAASSSATATSSRTRASSSTATASRRSAPTDQGAGRRDARQPRRQDGDAGDRRCARAHQHDRARARDRSAPARALRRQRGTEHGTGRHRRDVHAARQDRARHWRASSRRPRHHRAGEGPDRSALLDHDARGRPQGRPGECGEEGRHHQDLGRRSRRQVSEADAAALQRGDRRSAQAEAAGHRAHLLARGRQGVAEGRHRQLRARHSRSRHGR